MKWRSLWAVVGILAFFSCKKKDGTDGKTRDINGNYNVSYRYYTQQLSPTIITSDTTYTETLSLAASGNRVGVKVPNAGIDDTLTLSSDNNNIVTYQNTGKDHWYYMLRHYRLKDSIFFYRYYQPDSSHDATWEITGQK